MTAILVKWGMYAIAIVAALIAITLAWQHFVAAPYKAQGDAAATARLQPQITKLTSDLDSCRADNTTLQDGIGKLEVSIKATNTATEALQDAQRQAEARATAAQNVAASAKRAQAATLAKLTALTAGAPSTAVCTGICADARSILADLARTRRVQ